jgi:predicted Zn finger-like uncharacterized protein
MIIQCGKCRRKFKIDDSRIKYEGSNVRCSGCGHIFIVKRDDQVTGHDPLTEGPEKGPQADINEDINIERTPIDRTIEEGLSESSDIDQDRIDHPEEEPREDVRDAPDEDMLDMEIDNTPIDTGNWEEFVSISKTGDHARDIETNERSMSDKEENDFNWDNINIEEESGDSSPRIPEMFEDDESTDSEEHVENIDAHDKSESHGYEYKRGSTENLILDTDSPDKYLDSGGDFGRPEESTIHHRSEIYGSQKKSKRGAIGKLAYTLMIAAVFVVIITASLTILVNLELIPEENVTKAKTLIQSVLPVNITEEQTRDIVITEHSGNWMNTRYGPLYVITGMIKNISDRPIHYIKIRSEFVSAGKTLYEDTIYAGNTFSENELKVTKIEDIVFKLKKKNGDIDYYDMKKLSGLNYDVQPGESIPFFAVFPYDSTVLGLKYNLEVVHYEDSSIN